MEIRIVVFFASASGGLSLGAGRSRSIPVSLMKDAVTIKKINMMNTISNMGVMLISSSSSPRLALLRIVSLLRGLDSPWGCLEFFSSY